MAQYSARCINDFATITEPLRALTKQVNDWQWGKKCIKAFNAELASYFDVKKAIEIVVDASPVGLAALLIQEKRVVVYASRALSDVVTRYSQTERKAQAVFWPCRYFVKFINRAPHFRATSDHKPLVTIWKKPRPPLRLHNGWSSSISPVQITQPTICSGIWQGRGSCAAVSKIWQSTI